MELISGLRALPQTSVWTPSPGIEIPMPVVFDLRPVDPATGAHQFLFEATIDLVAGTPAMTRFVADAPDGLDLVRLQREFRWSTPIDVVTRLVPKLIADGLDPFTQNYPVDGFPEVIDSLLGPRSRALTDTFLETIARDYLAIGRGYAQQIADARGVSRRTVVSWVEKARQRGILTSDGVGQHGGRIIPAAERAASHPASATERRGPE